MKRIYITTILVLLFAAIARAGTATTQPVSNTRWVEFNLTIVGDTGINWPNKGAVESLLQGIAAALPAEIRNSVKMNLSPTSMGEGELTLEFTISVDPPAPPEAREIGQQAIELLREDYPDTMRKMLTDLTGERANVQKELQNDETSLTHETQESVAAGTSDLTPDDIRNNEVKLFEEKGKIAIDIAARAARQDALSRELENLEIVAEKKAKDDPIAKELAKIVDLRAQDLADMQEAVKKGLMDASSLRTPEAALAEAKVKVLERQEAVAQAASADSGDLRRELANLEVDQAEALSRLTAIENLAKSLADAQARLISIGDYKSKIDKLNSQLDEISGQTDNAKQGLAHPPTVTAAEESEK